MKFRICAFVLATVVLMLSNAPSFTFANPPTPLQAVEQVIRGVGLLSASNTLESKAYYDDVWKCTTAKYEVHLHANAIHCSTSQVLLEQSDKQHLMDWFVHHFKGNQPPLDISGSIGYDFHSPIQGHVHMFKSEKHGNCKIEFGFEMWNNEWHWHANGPHTWL